MKLVTFKLTDETRTGVLKDDQIIDLNLADPAIPTDMVALLAAGEEMIDRVKAVIERDPPGTPIANVQLKAPVLSSGKVICLGLNYRAHADEAGMAYPTYPILFHKARTSLIGHQEAVQLPSGASRADFEAELAIIIGKTAKNLSTENALDCVAGYACANDISEREWQMRTNQWSAGKMIDTFGPLGPALVTKDEIPDPNALSIRLTYNGAEMQNSHTGDQIFHVVETLVYISAICTLEPGDVILTGTPEGVGFTRQPPIALKDGDVMTVEISGLGALTNHVIQM